MLRLNLLAEEAKREIKYLRLYYLSLQTEIFLLFLILLVGGIFWAAENILVVNSQKTSQETSRIIATDGHGYNSKAQAINAQLAAIAQIQTESVSYSQLFKKVTALIPAGVSLSYINIDVPNLKIRLRGQAKTRDNFLALESNLQGANFLNQVNIPLQDKLKKTNIEFNDIELGLNAANLP